MPTGPFGLPRVTSIGPFVEEDAEQEVVINKETKRRGMEAWHQTMRDSGFASGPVPENNVHGKIELRVKVEKDFDSDDPLSEFREFANKLRNETAVAKITYTQEEGGPVAKIGKVEVDEEFRKMGIGTKIKELAIEEMRDDGVEVILTETISPEGKSLAERTGFKSIGGPFMVREL